MTFSFGAAPTPAAANTGSVYFLPTYCPHNQPTNPPLYELCTALQASRCPPRPPSPPPPRAASASEPQPAARPRPWEGSAPRQRPPGLDRLL